MGKIILKGHTVSKGKVTGKALVSHKPISFMGGLDPETGLVIEKGHELEGVNVAGKILIFPVGKGSSVGSYRLYEMVHHKAHPIGIINLRADPIVAVGAIFSDIPMVDRLDGDPLELIKSGDTVELDADQGTVTVDPDEYERI